MFGDLADGIGWVRRRVSLVAVIAPSALFLGLTWATLHDFVSPQKPTLEVLSVVLLVLAVAISMLSYAVRREAFLLWMAAFVTLFLLRELKVLPSNGLYLLLLLLVWKGWRSREALRPHIDRSGVVSTIVAGMVAYGIAVQIDERNWIQWMPGTKATVWSPVEETMEVAGHVALVIAVVLAAVPWRVEVRGDAVQPKA